jgi:hypothetical protein
MQTPNLTAIRTAVEAGRVEWPLITRFFEYCLPLKGGDGGQAAILHPSAPLAVKGEAAVPLAVNFSSRAALHPLCAGLMRAL